MDRSTSKSDLLKLTLLDAMLEVMSSDLLPDDNHRPGYKIYSIVIGPIGFNISARLVMNDQRKRTWDVATWYTYNA